MILDNGRLKLMRIGSIAIHGSSISRQPFDVNACVAKENLYELPFNDDISVNKFYEVNRVQFYSINLKKLSQF